MDEEIKEGLRSEIKSLILQEIRLYRLKQTFTPDILIDEISRSIEEIKREIIRLARTLSYRERVFLLRRMMQEAVDEEIDRAIQLREKKCLRCIYGRFYDEWGTPFLNLPVDSSLIQSIGCKEYGSDFEGVCKRFIERASAHSIEDYLDELSLLYEFREWIDHIEELWQDYFNK